MLSPEHIATWIICALAVCAVIIRPWDKPEAVWPVLGACVLVLCSLVSASDAFFAVRRGADVYLFLVGMMILAEFARHEGLFDWLAAYAVTHSRGSSARLFGLIYLVGTAVTIFLSNDATAVVLTPAVYAATRRAGADPLPYLFICAFIANAASFVLPISNPANLVVFGAQMPSLMAWLVRFGVASIFAIALTYVALRWTQRGALTGRISDPQHLPTLMPGGRLVAAGIAATALLLLIASALEWPLGLTTFIAGAATGTAIILINREPTWQALRGVSWSVLPLVAGLFVLAQAIEATGLLAPLTRWVAAAALSSPHAAAFVAGSGIALACNAANNLPVGLILGTLTHGSPLPPRIVGAMLVGVDLGPNLSVTGSLATLLWLVALRREGQNISAWKFLAVGSCVMPPALIAALGGVSWLSPG
jgi:arsenical pump membrane protein